MARYSVQYTNAGVPQTGLSPTVTWRYEDGSGSPGAAPTVNELDAVNAPGWYYFDASPTKKIVVTVDGTATVPNAERYVGMVISQDDYATTEARLAVLDTAIADHVWDEARAGHVGAGTFGAGVLVDGVNAGAIVAASFGAAAIDGAALAATASAEIADAVWDEARAGHVGAGTFGEGVLVESVNAGGIVAASFAAGAIDAAAIATDAIDSDAIATDALAALELDASAVAEIADGVWDELLQAHVSGGSAGEAMDRMFRSMIRTEGSSEHIADANDVAGEKFYAPNVPVLGRSGSFAMRRALFTRTTTGIQEVCRVIEINESPPGDRYFRVAEPLATKITGGVAIGDKLVVMNVDDPSADEIMGEPMAAHDTDGTFGDNIRRVLALRQSNMRTVWDTWTAAGQPTHGFVYVYDSKADLVADTAPWALSTGKYEITQSYTGINPTTYISTKEA